MEKWIIVMLCVFLTCIMTGLLIWQILALRKQKEEEAMNELIALETTPKDDTFKILDEVYRIYGNEVLLPETFETIYQEYQNFKLLFLERNAYALYSAFPTTSFSLNEESKDTYLFCKKLEYLAKMNQIISTAVSKKGKSRVEFFFCQQYIFKNYQKGDNIEQMVEEYFDSIHNQYYLFWNKKSFYRISEGKLDYTNLLKVMPDFDIKRIVKWKDHGEGRYIAIVKPSLTKVEKERFDQLRLQKEEEKKLQHTFALEENPYQIELGHILNSFLILKEKEPFHKEELYQFDEFYKKVEKDLYHNLKEKYADYLLPFQDYFLFELPLLTPMDYMIFNDSFDFLIQRYFQEKNME